MLKKLQPWRILIGLMVIFIFSSLFIFIYEEQVKLPSDNWSNPIEIDAYKPKMDFESLSSNNTLALGIDDNTFININVIDNELTLKTFTTSADQVNSKTLSLESTASEVTGTYSEGRLKLIVLSEAQSEITFLDMDPVSFELKDSKTMVLDNMDFKLSKDHVTAFNHTEVAYVDRDLIKRFSPEFEGRIELAEISKLDNDYFISAITMKGSTYHLDTFTSSASGEQMHQLYILPSLSAIKPINVTMASVGDETIIISTMKHMRFITNYVDFFILNQHDPSDFSHSGYEVDTYEAIPYLIEEDNGSLSYLINFWATNLGRTEIAKGIQAYPNLYKTTHGTDEFIQLTKSERSSVKPSYLHLGSYDYLIYNEQTDTDNIVYMASSDPKLIAASRDYSTETLFDIFMRTITTYPALILAGIPPLMTIILPLLVITAPILMFKLNWAEQNKHKMTVIIFAVFIISKLYTFGFDLFPFFTADNLWPRFMAAPVAHWSALFILSAMTFSVYLLRNRTRVGKNDHFLKQITFYVILDLLVHICFFLPYSII